jgi:hypothetical protein
MPSRCRTALYSHVCKAALLLVYIHVCKAALLLVALATGVMRKALALQGHRQDKSVKTKVY